LSGVSAAAAAAEVCCAQHREILVIGSEIKFLSRQLPKRNVAAVIIIIEKGNRLESQYRKFAESGSNFHDSTRFETRSSPASIFSAFPSVGFTVLGRSVRLEEDSVEKLKNFFHLTFFHLI